MNIGAIITIILVVAWVVKGLASVVNPQEGEEKKKRPARSLEDWDEQQAQRRAQMSDQQQAMSQMRADSSTQAPSQMTMAERIELARQRARQQAGLQSQGEDQAEALQHARTQAEQKAQQDRQADQLRAQRERAAQQQRAQRQRDDRVKQQRRRQAQAQAEQQAKQQRRSKQQSRQQKAKSAPRATTGSNRERVVAESMKRIHEGHGHSIPVVTKLSGQPQTTGAATTIGSLDRNALRKAFIMKELLDKPIALRDPQADLLS